MKGKRLGRKKKRKGLSKKESLYGILLAVVIVSLLFIYFSLRSSSNQTGGPFQFKAAIVDHLSLFEPNPTFNQTASTILEEAGFTVDYYPWDKVDVDFYRKLPKRGYGLIVLRVHSALADVHPTWVCLFTSELYESSKYRQEQIQERIGIACFLNPDAGYFFGINPDFIRLSAEGRFCGSVVIMMGCDGLKYPSMAEAFIEKGAKAYISWSGPVSASHTDQATAQLLEHLVTGNQTIKQAVDETREEVGPDPINGSVLEFYPPQAENYAIPYTQSNLTMNVAEINPETTKLKEIISLKQEKIMKEPEKTGIHEANGHGSKGQ